VATANWRKKKYTCTKSCHSQLAVEKFAGKTEVESLLTISPFIALPGKSFKRP
jgi:mevalonate pyrophosphate decarboxylase